jgi:Tfp pilus assembly protein PilV
MLKKSLKRSKKGIALVEVLISLFIFSLMLASMIGVFSTLLQRRSDVRRMQQQTEEFSLASSYMAKKIRMSDYGSCSSSTCTVHDHSLNDDVTYTFSGNNLTETIAAVGVPGVIATNVTGGFVAHNTLSGNVPIITVHMVDPLHMDTAVQTTLSLRSY